MKEAKHTPFSILVEKALIRASARAKALSEQTGTPFVGWRDDKAEDLNATSKQSTSAPGPMNLPANWASTKNLDRLNP